MDKPEVLRIKTEDGESVHYSALYEGVTEQDKLYAKEVLNETEKGRAQGMQRLKDYMQRENLSCPDDNYLLGFLRSTKYNFKKVEAKLRNALAARKHIISKLAMIETATIETIVDDLIFAILPYRDKQGRMLFYTRPCYNLDRYDVDDVCYCCLAFLIFCATYSMTSIHGWAWLLDCKTPSLYHFYPVIKGFKNGARPLMNLATRIARIDALNEHVVARLCFLAVRPLLSEKVSSRVFFHGSNMKKNIRQLYHPDLLPEDLDGNLGPVTNKHYREKFLAFIEKLKKEYQENK